MRDYLEKKYVVLDVETNGLSSINDDLLSISIFKPDDKKTYNRFLPLELNQDVYTTHINGIKKKDLRRAKGLSQEDVDTIIKDFELDRRIILTYGNLDERFIRNYFKRKKLKGFDILKFYNFKHDIISSGFSGGNITKDNMCNLYKIKKIKRIHTGANDCRLEWKLFKKMNGKKLLVINDKVFELTEEYIIPVSYLSTYPNFKYCFNQFPSIDINTEEIKRLIVKGKDIRKFEANISGVTIEHLINVLLGVKIIDSADFLLENKRKLKYIGRLPSTYREIPILLNSDGTITGLNIIDKEKVDTINQVIGELKSKMTPLICYLKEEIFRGEDIFSHELVISPDRKVLSVCDLSSNTSVVEIKSHIPNLKKMKYQLYYESRGRKSYLLHTDWSKMPKQLDFIISKIEFIPKIKKNK